MNKLHKTTYGSRQPNYNNFLGTSSGSRQITRQNEIKTSTITKKQVLDFHTNTKLDQRPYSRQIQKKIEIDPTLLFNIKKNSRNSTRPIIQKQIGPKIILNKTQTKFYDSNAHKQRPRSKQQPRLKINLDPELKNRQPHFLQRPHTSKGPRPLKSMDDVKKRKMSFENNEDLVINLKDMDRRAMISSSQSRRPSKTSKFNFETSIDPQFLNLFAAN